MKQLPHCTRRAAIGLAALGLLPGDAAPAVVQDPAPAAEPQLRSATVVFVRHAEKLEGDDPGLSPAGERRAKQLAALLSAVGVTRLFSTDYRRTRATLAPLATARGLSVELYDARGSRAFAAGLGGDGGLDRGAVAVVAGHSNTLPAMVQALGGALQELQRDGVLDESEYDRVVIVTVAAVGDDPMRAVQVLDLRVAGAA